MKIALTYTGWDGKHENYVKWLKGEGKKDPEAGDIDVIRLSFDEDSIDRLAECDGLVLSGGVDVHPSYYGAGLTYRHAPETWDKERDLFEQALLRTAIDRKLPVLGVCRGLQLINVFLNGTLLQDLGELGDGVHEDRDGHDRSHPVKLESRSLLRQIAGTDGGLVNSAHHQAIARLGEGLWASGRAEDGTVEAIEWEAPAGRPFLLAVQWHPERMEGFQVAGLYQSIRDRFIDEAKK